jgi:2-polyprenyl-6-hydroxyphenyl methylase/3-demethylubiquinone-9 3-methyltransferase
MSTSLAVTTAADPAEIERFRNQAARWWDDSGPARPLHDLNPLRMAFIAEHAGLDGVAAADVGCGGGLVAEGLARAGARVTAVDPTPDLLEVAKLHALESGLTIDYRLGTSADLLAEGQDGYQVVTALELIEHVPDQPQLIRELAALLAPGGRLFLSTLDRKPSSFLLGIVAAEYLLGLLPRGTHRYDRFLRPSELIAMGRAAGLQPVALEGLGYDPFSRRAWRSPKPKINYLLCMQKS